MTLNSGFNVAGEILKNYKWQDLVFQGGGLQLNSTGHIIAHIEPIADWVGGPVFNLLESMGTVAINTGTINNILEITQQIQFLSFLNFAMSGVNVGTNLVSSNLIYFKLKRIDRKLDFLSRQVDALLTHANRELLKEASNYIKHSISYTKLLEKRGLKQGFSLTNLPKRQKVNEAVEESKVEELLNRFETFIEDSIKRYRDRDLVSISLEYIHILYAAYSNLLKSYLNSAYMSGWSLEDYRDRLERAEELMQALSSEEILDFIHRQCVFSSERLFTDPEIDDIVNLYQLSCQEAFARIQSHQKILANTPKKKYRQWKKQTENAGDDPFVWIVH